MAQESQKKERHRERPNSAFRGPLTGKEGIVVSILLPREETDRGGIL